MCGIAGVYIKDPSAVKNHPGFERFMDHLFLGIEGRGKHATGFVAVSRAGRVVMDKNDVAASDFIKDRERMPEDPWYVLLHTRYATKGDVADYRNNHPVLHGTCFTTHNGSIDNDDELFERHGFNRYAEVDTEILPALVGITNFEPERIRETFKDVDGSCAMATIDPVNHPGKVLLLRTNHKSPLYLLETKKFVVWGSTQVSIKEAWGKVLGTPPKDVKLKYIPEWRFMILEGQPEGKTHELIKPPTPTYQNNWAGHYGAGAQVRDPVVGDWVTSEVLRQRKANRERVQTTTTEQPSTLITVEQVRNRVREMRTRDLGRATTWEQRSYAQPGRKWEHCNVCRQMVAAEDHDQTIGRGRMCVDCAEMYTLIQKEREAVVIDQPEKHKADEGIVELVRQAIPNDMRVKLNNWGDDELSIHAQVMGFLAEGSGLDVAVLDYLMFRANIKDVEDVDNVHLVTLVEKLWDEYDTEYESLWDEIDAGGSGSFKKIIKPAPKAIGPGASGGSASIQHFSNKDAVKRVNNCLFCRKKPNVRLIMADRAAFDFNYCNRHHDKCNMKNCNGDANHTLRSGKRVCHTHARGQKCCYPDSWLEDAGYAMEVV